MKGVKNHFASDEERRAYRNRVSREWTERNREKSRAIKKRWREKFPERSKACSTSWQNRHKERVKELARIRYNSDLELARARQKAKNKRNAARRTIMLRKIRARYSTRPEYRINNRLTAAIHESLKGKKNRRSWQTLVGYTKHELMSHLERQFTEGMSWEVFLSGAIDIDHIIPRSRFHYTSEADAQFKECWALSNLRPMWATENRRRGALDRWARASSLASDVGALACL